jgi:hypothetical protein
MAQQTQALKPVLAYPNRTTDQLCLKIKQQSELLGRIKSVLPTELAGHVSHCVVNGKKLLVYTDSANWATQLRFYGATMLTVFESAHSAPIATIHIKINHLSASAQANSKRKAIVPNPSVAYEIHKLSLNTTDHQLKQALDKLSSTLVRLQSNHK